jgi:hypothetical protein
MTRDARLGGVRQMAALLRWNATVMVVQANCGQAP